ncbi:MAG: tetratricopeptide repeat protein [Proteobacteria bacterium]|nr:tetratricopeptide repeat protein [Pseudomonadota bacterium]
MNRPAGLKQQPAAYERALALHRAGKLEEAAQAYRKILEKNHTSIAALNNLGLIEKAKGNYDEALKLYDRALLYKPDYIDGMVNKGNLLQIRGKHVDSIPLLEKAVSLNPKHLNAKITLGWGYIMCNQNVAAAKTLEEACALDPSSNTAWQNLATAYYRQGLVDKSIAAGKESLKRLGGNTSHSNLIFTLHFSPHFYMQEIYDLALDWEKKYARPLMPPKASWPQKVGGSDKRLRVGFISADFRKHPVSYFFASMLEARKPDDNWDPIL